MDVITKKLAEIRPYPNNPRRNDDAVDAVAASISEFGWKQPIVVDRNGVIVAGHTRYKAAQKLGLAEAPVVIADDLTEEQVRAYRLADNKTAELAGWDFDLQAEELAALSEIDMSAFGFDLEAFANEVGGAQEDDYDPSIADDDEPLTKMGDLWALGNHRLLCGDATNEQHVAALMRSNKADLVVTDPPYGVCYAGGARIEEGKIKNNGREALRNDALNYDELYAFLTKSFDAMKRHSSDRAAFYVFYAHSRSREFLNAFNAAGLKQRSIIVWHKIGGGFGDFMAQYMNAYEPCIYGSNGEAVNWNGPNNERTVWEIEKRKQSDLHPTMKPVELIARAIKNSSKPGQIVLDTFGGSGTTMIASEQLGRRCRMVELDPHYCDVIIDRWEVFTGGKAEKLEG